MRGRRGGNSFNRHRRRSFLPLCHHCTIATTMAILHHATITTVPPYQLVTVPPLLLVARALPSPFCFRIRHFVPSRSPRSCLSSFQLGNVCIVAIGKKFPLSGQETCVPGPVAILLLASIIKHLKMCLNCCHRQEIATETRVPDLSAIFLLASLGVLLPP